MRSDQLLYVGQVFERALLVGDPGQLNPFSPIDDTRWRGYADGPINPAIATVLHNHPDSPLHRLPVSRRLPELCAPRCRRPSTRRCRSGPGPRRRTAG